MEKLLSQLRLAFWVCFALFAILSFVGHILAQNFDTTLPVYALLLFIFTFCTYQIYSHITNPIKEIISKLSALPKKEGENIAQALLRFIENTEKLKEKHQKNTLREEQWLQSLSSLAKKHPNISNSSISDFIEDYQKSKTAIESLQQEMVLQHQSTCNWVRKLPAGLFFLDKAGKITSHHSLFVNDIIGNVPIANKKLTSIFFSHDQKNTIEEWLIRAENTSVAALEIETKFKRILANGSCEIIFLKITLTVVKEKDCWIVGFIEERSKEKKLEKILSKNEEEQNKRFEIFYEIIVMDPGILKEFAKDISKKRILFEEKMFLFQESTVNSGIITELNVLVQEIANKARLLNFDTLVKEASRIGTLLDILSGNKLGNFRIDQLLEAENLIAEFLQTLGQYHQAGSKFLEATQGKTSKKLAAKNTQIIGLQNQLKLINQLTYSLQTSPQETNEALKDIGQTLSGLMDFPKTNSSCVFDALDLLQRGILSLVAKIEKRKVEINIQNNETKVLAFSDPFKIDKLLTLIISISILRAEVGSSLTIKSQIIPNKKREFDTWQVTTSVGIRNTDSHILATVKKRFQEYQVLCQKCRGQLEHHKRGFTFSIPIVVNKKFGEKLYIGALGQVPITFEETLQELNSMFPFSFEVVVAPSDYDSLSLIVVTAEVLENLATHIRSKLQIQSHIIPLVGLYKKETKQIRDKMLELGALDCISLPIRKKELRWCILRCLAYDFPTHTISKTRVLNNFSRNKQQKGS